MGLVKERDGISVKPYLYDEKSSDPTNMYSQEETTCLDNCTNKAYHSDRMLRAYVPLRMAQTKLTEN